MSSCTAGPGHYCRVDRDVYRDLLQTVVWPEVLAVESQTVLLAATGPRHGTYYRQGTGKEVRRQDDQ